jgi:PadR family transcriptional regulator, regulatory protein PadR
VSSVGELEVLLLLSVLRLGEEAYGVSVRDELERRTGRRLSRGAVYATLRRLESKGFLVSELGEPTPERGGRAKRFLGLSAAGLEALQSSLRDLDRMREGIPDPAVEKLG